MMEKVTLVFLISFAGFIHSTLAQRNFEFDCALDLLVDSPANWEITPDVLDEVFAKPERMESNVYFEWLTKNRDRAHFIRKPFTNVEVNLTLLEGELPVEEAIVDFSDGKLLGVTFSVMNRGDSGVMDPDEFQRRLKLSGQMMGRNLEIRPSRRKSNPTQGLLTDGWTWISIKGMAVVEHNPEATEGKPEFLRLRMMRRDARGAMAASMQSRTGAMVRLGELPSNVKKESNGDVFITGIPMVDQGPKGYCVVASAQRLFEYYGIPCDQHQLAQIAGTSADGGTSTMAMSEALGKIDHRFATRFTALGMLATNGKLYEPDRELRLKDEIEFDDFEKEVRNYVDDGIPLLWALTLGRFPEEPSIAQQAGGGHMRMIIGYNEKEGDLIFSDSWGAGHEMKRMKMNHAFQATHGLFVMHPTVH